MKELKGFLFIWLAIGIIALSFGAGFVTSQWLARTGLLYLGPEELKPIHEAWHILFEDFIGREELDPTKLSEGAIEGMIEAVDDPYTSYLDAEVYQLWLSALEGSFEGIGAEVSMEDGQLVIIAPIDGSPAEEAGIKAGDRVLEIDYEPVPEMTSYADLIEAILKIRGPADTTVTLRVRHESGEEELITITRAKIDLPSVDLESVSDGIAHIRITHFSEQTGSELGSALEEVLSQQATSIILDLRDNPGGLLDAAVAVASQFLEEGIVVWIADGGEQALQVEPGGLATDLTLVVLVNESSASASEVVAAALQEEDRAPLIGTKTFGKGSATLVYELSDGSALNVTYAHWLTPDGDLIEGEGLTPDIEVEGADAQLERAIEYLQTGE